MCGKLAYSNAHDARRAHRCRGRRIRAYFCKACRAWHVTTTDHLGRKLG